MTDYFSRLEAETPTRAWVNNPTGDEIDRALAHGAVGCTTNPAFGGGLLRRAPSEILPIVDECLVASDDDRRVAQLVQERLVGRIASKFRPLFEATGGNFGFVSIQGSPDLDVICSIPRSSKPSWRRFPLSPRRGAWDDWPRRSSRASGRCSTSATPSSTAGTASCG